MQRSISPGELEELLRFEIVPTQLLEEANRLPSLRSSSTNIHSANDFGVDGLLSDNQLRQVASQASRKNWSKLAITLGFLEYDIEAYKVQNNYDSTATVNDFLFNFLLRK